jgi:hypothetical protein
VVIQRFELSDYRDSSSEGIARAYWTNTAANRAPYERGRLTALVLDAQMRNLDDAVRLILARTRKAPLTNALIQQAFREIAGNGAVAALDNMIGQNQRLRIPPQALGKAFALDTTSLAKFDVGFDVPASLKAKHVVGVAADGPAARAGLPEGASLTGIDIANGNPSKNARVKVKDASGERWIEYAPHDERMFAVPYFISATRPGLPSFDVLTRADSANALGTRLYTAKSYGPAASSYLKAAQTRGYPGRASSLYNAACSLALAGDADAAIRALRDAVSAGYHDARGMQADADLVSLHQRPDWKEVVRAVTQAAASFEATHGDPARVLLVTSDIPSFWQAYDEAKRATTDSARVVAYQNYIMRGTAGLYDYYRYKINGADKLMAFVEKHRDYYDAVRASTLRIADADGEIRAAMTRLKRYVPNATFPDVYFVVGRLSSGGTSTSQGLLIGSEMYSRTPATPIDSLSLGLQRIVRGVEEVPHVIAHEFVHYVQIGSAKTLLRNALREGGAEFIAQLIEPSPNTPYYMTWGLAHEAQVWQQFELEMSGPSQQRWIGGNAMATAEWPADLGYFVGYRIAESYFNRQKDKVAAVAALLDGNRAEEVLAASGYRPIKQ